MNDDPADDAVRYDGEAEAYVADLDLAGATEPSVEIASILARIADRGVTDLPPLRDSVEPEALDRLLAGSASADARVRVSFDYLEYTVIVSGSGEMRVREATGP